mgnify:CR=1 FL=1
MNNLQELSNKLHEYNQRNCTAWAILLCTPRTDEVFIVSEVDNDLSPDWWPNNDTGETIEKALELVPKEETFKLKAYGDQGGQFEFIESYTKSQLKKIAELCS